MINKRPSEDWVGEILETLVLTLTLTYTHTPASKGKDDAKVHVDDDSAKKNGTVFTVLL